MKNIAYLLITIIVSFIGCSGTIRKENNQTAKDKVTITRFDKDMHNYLQQPDAEKETGLKTKYATLLPAFGRITVKNSDQASIFDNIKEYFAHPALKQIYKDALNSYNDVSAYEEELTDANGLIAEHFAGRKLPELAMHVSGFKENVIIVNNLISLSIDKYMGSDYIAYQDFFQPFQRQQMQSKYIVRDYLKAWLMSDIIKTNDDEQNLLSAMVTEGKVLYALSVLLPEKDEDDIVGYTSQQADWCKINEKTMWQTIVKKNHLFSTDNMVITRFVNDAANTPLVAQDAPGRVGCWVGLQLVEKFAKKKGVSLQEVINTDAQTILKEGKYNP